MRKKSIFLAMAFWFACFPAVFAQEGKSAIEPAFSIAQAEQPLGQENYETFTALLEEASDAKSTSPGQSPAERDASPNRTITFGVGIGMINVAEEQKFSGDTPTTTLFTDLNFGQWLQFRIGVGQYSAMLQENSLSTQTLDLVYMVGGQFVGPIEAFALFGVSKVSSILEVASAGQSVSSSGTGTLLGGMLVYGLSSFRIGGQLVVINNTGDFEGVAIADGSSQLQLVAAFDWF